MSEDNKLEEWAANCKMLLTELHNCSPRRPSSILRADRDVLEWFKYLAGRLLYQYEKIKKQEAE